MQSQTHRTRVLILEAQAIVAMDVEGILEDAGLVVAASLPTCADALNWLEDNVADVALVDMHLLDGTCECVLRRLVERRIPFVVFSGAAENDDTRDPVFLAGDWLEKPAHPGLIVAALERAVGRGRAAHARVDRTRDGRTFSIGKGSAAERP
jgi:DNA-binding response OmpR family regulator